MDRSAAETKVEWREWGRAPFETAERAGKPVLLSLSAPWSEACREMDRRTYSEPRIAANVNDGFVPVRVDVDRNPRVRERYNMGGFPSTVFATPAGTVLTGATFLGPDGFREILDAVRRTWDASGTAAGSVPRALREASPPGGDVSPAVEEHMVEQLVAAFDDEFGGWGTDVKFPLPRTVEFALVRARDQATRTLEAVRTHLLDTYDGGFYRFARGRDWSDPQREKLTDENAALLRAFAHGYRYTGEEAYRETAETTVEYLTNDCWTGEAFAASQGGDAGYYRLEPSDRERADPPGLDPTVVAGHNALAADALFTYAAYIGDERARRYGERALGFVVEELVSEDGAVTHYVADDGTSGETGTLLAQARTLVGLTTAASVTGDPGPAAEVADYAIERLRDESGAVRDGPLDGPGLLDHPLYPLDTNVELADGLVDLWGLTGRDRYREAARAALDAFAGATDRMGVEVAAYASAVARSLAPRVVAVGTPAGSDLHRAALRLADHETVVSPGDDRADSDAVLLEDGDPAGRADTPSALEGLLTDASDPG
jgi:uncharacterized protein YyaL (SSP411 family)